MGWSELTAVPDLDRIFKREKKKYAMSRVLQVQAPYIMI